MHARKSFENNRFRKKIIKETLKKLIWYYILRPVPFYGEYYEKQKVPGINSFSSVYKTCLEKFAFIWSRYHLRNFDDLIKNHIRVISKITLANLFNPMHDFIIFPFSSDPLNPKNVERKEKITKNWTSPDWRKIFRWNKKHFS